MEAAMISTLMKMKSVDRFSSFPVVEKINLLEHGFRVAVIFKYICEFIDAPATADQIFSSMMHDAVETLTGDLLYPVKRAINGQWDYIEEGVVEKHGPHLKALTEKGFKETMPDYIVYCMKLADYLEGLLYIKEEWDKGNKSKMLEDASSNYREAINDVVKKYPETNGIVSRILYILGYC